MEHSPRDFIIISHRGASAYYPENTLLSFSKAIELNADMLEFDVRKTSDDKIIVIHDDRVDRTTNGKGYVREMSFNSLRTLDAGSGEKIPALHEVLELGRGKVKFAIELKEERTEELVLETVRDLSLSDDVFIITFRQKILRRVKAFDPAVRTALISLIPYNTVKDALFCEAAAIGIHHYFLTPQIIEKARMNNLFIFVWTVDDQKKCERIRDMGATGVVTNKPDILSNSHVL